MHSFVTGAGCQQNYFELFIILCIVLNMVHMAVDYDDSPTEYKVIVDNINYFFSFVFLFECLVKLIAFGR